MMKKNEIPELKSAIKAFRADATLKTQETMFNALLNADLLNPAIIDETIKENPAINFCMIENQKNELFFLAFTDKEEMAKWQKDEKQKTVVMKFHNYADMILNDRTAAKGFVINPHSADSMAYFTKETIKTIKETYIEGKISNEEIKADEITVKPLQDIPTDLYDALKAYASANDEIKAMYLTAMQRNKKDCLLLIVDYKGDRNKIIGSIGQTASEHLKETILNIIEYDTDFGRKTCENLEAFYKKSN